MYIPIDLLRQNEAANQMASADIASQKDAIKTKYAPALDTPQRVQARRAMLAAVASEPLDIAYERYVGTNDLLPVNYLQIGAARSRAVGRLRYFDLRVNQYAMATGFLISPDLILTNRHVFSDVNAFKNPSIDFDYAYDVDGRELDKITFELDPGKFFHANQALDYALIGIADTDESGAHRPAERGCLVLNPGQGKAGIGDYATIIQHPDGNYQEIALRGNQILQINPDALIYVADTSEGSSGSAVFNDQWQVIALHSAGVAKKDDQGRYVDKDNNPIPVVNNHIDSSKIVWISNTGIRVSSIVADWTGQPAIKSNKYLQFLNDPNYSDDKTQNVSPPGPESFQIQSTDPMKSIEINPGPNRPGLTININVNFGDAHGAAVSEAAPRPAKTSGPKSAVSPGLSQTQTQTQSFESKLEDEQSMDYSACNGFDDQFMGASTPLPALGQQLARKVAFFTSNPKQFILKYDHYSTIVHSVRRMPIVSAINIEGDPGARKDHTKRQDVWMRDNRIDFDVQLSDAYYKSSGFDKGHMSRREDADWGDTADTALSAANLTCMYSNACPQVPDINRAVFGKHGLWGELEMIVLEQGVEAESGDTSKICVYNGPIFVATDPTYKGVQVPLRFFKIIAWRNGAGEMKATAFVLSQEDLVGGIQFEELQFDKQFIEHQSSIAFIEHLTDLTFTGIRDFDTSPDKGNINAVAPIDRGGLESHIAQHAKGKTKPKPH